MTMNIEHETLSEPVSAVVTVEKVEDRIHTIAEVVVVYATAVVENSPGEADVKGLEGLVFRERHLQENIQKIEFGQHFSQRSRNSHFTHTIEMKFYVKTKKLWEGARSYIWRHFGQMEWEKGNGTKVKMNRLHVKS